MWTLLAFVFIVLAAVAIWIVSLIKHKCRLWASVMLVAVLLVPLSGWVIPGPSTLTVYGIRDHVLKMMSPDDLRRFAADVQRNARDIGVFDLEPQYQNKDQAQELKKLQNAYPFLKWPTGNPFQKVYVTEDADIVMVYWGGALSGQWGFSIRTDGKKNEPLANPDAVVVRASDDIYFYYKD